MTSIETFLENLEIIDKNEMETFYHKVRNSENVKVKRCKKTDIIFLSTNDYIDYSHYENWEATK